MPVYGFYIEAFFNRTEKHRITVSIGTGEECGYSKEVDSELPGKDC